MSDVTHPSGYERSDASPRWIAALAAGVAVFLIVVPFVLLVVYPDVRRSGGVPKELPVPPVPRLQVQPRTDLDQLRSEERELLQTYGWADRDHQIIHIPIEQAMQIVAERGLSGWPATGAAPVDRPLSR